MVYKKNEMSQIHFSVLCEKVKNRCGLQGQNITISAVGWVRRSEVGTVFLLPHIIKVRKWVYL